MILYDNIKIETSKVHVWREKGMERSESIYRQSKQELEDVQQKLRMIGYELGTMDLHRKAIITKSVKGKIYYYEQWRSEGKVHSRYLAPVQPGIIWKEEQNLLRKQELLENKKELEKLKKPLETFVKSLEREREKESLLKDYTFEVYWKDEITARVYVKGGRVTVSRFVEHPLKQLFADKNMTRYQLNKILELRCWDRNRADIDEILRHLGLKYYNPYEIVRKTHGVSYNDYIWFRFPGEKLTSKDVLVR